MKQISLATTSEFELVTKRTRKRVFLDEMSLVVPWRELVGLIQPFAPTGTGAKRGRPTFALETMLRVHFMQQWFTLSDPAMQEAFFDTPLYREFAQLEEFARLPDESTILRFRHWLEKHQLAEEILAVVNDILIQRGLLLKLGTVVDATLMAAPSSTKNKHHKRDPDMHSSKKGEQKNTAQLITLFALSNLWMVRSKPINRCKKRYRVERFHVKSRYMKTTDSLRHLAASYSKDP